MKHQNGSRHATIKVEVAPEPSGINVNEAIVPDTSDLQPEFITINSPTEEASGWNTFEDDSAVNSIPEVHENRGQIGRDDDNSTTDDLWDIEVEHKFPDPEFYDQMIYDISSQARATYGVNKPTTWSKTHTEWKHPSESRDQWIPIRPTFRTTWYRLLRDIREFYETGLLAPYSNPDIATSEGIYVRHNHYGYKWVSLYVKKRLDNLTFGQAQVLFDNEIPSIFVLQDEFYMEMDDKEITAYYDEWYKKIEALCASCIEANCTEHMTNLFISACCRDNHRTCDYCEWKAHCFHMFESYKRNSNKNVTNRDGMALAQC